MFGVILALVVVSFCVIFYAKKKPQEKILDVYTVPGQWFHVKYFLLLSLMFLKDYLFELKHFLVKEKEVNVEELECVQQLSEHEKGFDAVYIQAANKDGYYLSGGVERRHQGKANTVFYIVVPNLGLLRSENLPKTSVDQESDSLYFMKSYGGGGVSFSMVEPMKRWKVCYEGKMWIDKVDNLVDVVLDVECVSNSEFFAFECFDKFALARGIAKEEWTKQFFRNLQKSKSTQYEQMGMINGSLLVNGIKHDLQSMDSFRNHSFGHWISYHRYINHVIFLEDKTKIVVGILSLPSSTTELEIGYVQTSKQNFYTIEKCDLKLYQHGENGKPPREIAFTVWANGIKYEIKTICLEECFHFKGNDIEEKIFERFLMCSVNGISGRGISRWYYNNINNI